MGVTRDWDAYWLSQVQLVATMSTCSSRQTGAVIVRDRRSIATGFNGNVPGAPHCIDGGCPRCAARSGAGILTIPDELIDTGDDPHFLDRVRGAMQTRLSENPPAVVRAGENLDLCTCVHAEANAIAQCARYGVGTSGTTIYCTHRPCLDCIKLVAVSGITEVVWAEDYPAEYQIPPTLMMRSFRA